MAFLLALEALSFFETLLPFFFGELLRFCHIVDVHGIGVASGGISGGGGGMEGNRSTRGMLLCDSSSEVTLTEELVNFLIPAFGGSGNYLHAIDREYHEYTPGYQAVTHTHTHRSPHLSPQVQVWPRVDRTYLYLDLSWVYPWVMNRWQAI